MHVSWLQRPPISKTKTTKRQRPLATSSGVNSLLVAAGILQSRPRIPPVPPSGLPFPCERRNQCCVDSQLAPPQKWQAIGYDLDPAVIQTVDAGDVQVCHPRVGGHPGTRFAANPSCCSLQWSPPQLRRSPDCAQAERWSPKGSRVRRHRQERADNGKGRRGCRRSKRRKCSEEYVDRDGGENSAGIRPTLGFEESLAGWRQCLLEFCPEGLVE